MYQSSLVSNIFISQVHPAFTSRHPHALDTLVGFAEQPLAHVGIGAPVVVVYESQNDMAVVILLRKARRQLSPAQARLTSSGAGVAIGAGFARVRGRRRERARREKCILAVLGRDTIEFLLR